MVYYTSDTHFGHENIIRYCGRPFFTRGEMDEALIAKWNKRVGKEDTVYHLGDFAFAKRERVRAILGRLNGRKMLVRGNHDRSGFSMVEDGFEQCSAQTVHESEYGMISLSHLPPGPTDREGLGISPPVEAPTIAYYLCGHVHNLWARLGNVINVGVDVRAYEPKTLQELIAATTI